MTFHLVSTIDEVLSLVFETEESIESLSEDQSKFFQLPSKL